jgi:hypothetical protein
MNISLIWIKRNDKQEDSFLEEYLNLLKEVNLEKIVVGHTSLIRKDFTYIPFHELGLDEMGLICHKKNIGVLASSSKYCLVMHCDVRPCLSFFEEFKKIESELNDLTVYCPIGESENGNRGLTWCLYAGNHKDTNQEFCHASYISGGCLLASKKILRKYQWNQNLKHNQEEDFEFSQRLNSFGVKHQCLTNLKIIMKNSQ